MDGQLFRVFGSLIIEDKDAIKSLQNAEKGAKNSAKAVEDLSKKAAAMGKAIAVGAGIAVTALFGIAVKASETTDRIDKMSAKLGLSIKGFQEWDYILGQNGISIDSMQGGLKTLTNMYDELGKGSKTATTAFGRLGLSMDDLKGKSQEQVFDIVVKKLQGMENQTERAAIANDLLGRSGSELAPLLNIGAEATEELRDRAYKLGIVMSEDSVQAGVVFGDTLDDLKKSFGTVVAEIGIQVMPIFQRFANWIISNMPTIKTVAGGILNGIADSVKWVSDNLNWLLPVLGGVLAAFVAFQIITTIAGIFAAFTAITTGASGAMAIFNAVMLANPIGMVAIAIGVLVAAIAVLWMNWDNVSKFFTKTFDDIMSGFTKLINGFIDGLNWVIGKANSVPGINIPTIGGVKLGTTTTGSGVVSGSTPKPSGGNKNIQIQAYASGGIAYGDTLAQVGEYVGVKNNPEVIAPLDKLKELLGGSMDYDLLGDAVARAMRNVSVVMDDEKVGRLVDRRIMKGVV